jgi:shikimate dehydrogenase
MWPNIEKYPAIDYSAIGSSHLLFDLIYNPETTTFLQKGKDKGAMISNGLSMLHQQAEAAWKIWNQK